MKTRLDRFTQKARAYPVPAAVEDSDWEPDGVTLQVRFCEGPGTEPV
jgi:hypothetical protein